MDGGWDLLPDPGRVLWSWPGHSFNSGVSCRPDLLRVGEERWLVWTDPAADPVEPADPETLVRRQSGSRRLRAARFDGRRWVDSSAGLPEFDYEWSQFDEADPALHEVDGLVFVTWTSGGELHLASWSGDAWVPVGASLGLQVYPRDSASVGGIDGRLCVAFDYSAQTSQQIAVLCHSGIEPAAAAPGE